ncbi:MAG: cysteine-rich KTR domain-containing protein [Lachnospiraceae bacterium]|nr:cysteine-rich KTR domain-containing protein [Lachnospiraceae bacterium]
MRGYLICYSKTKNKIRKDTKLKKIPLFCPKCKRESLINAINLQVMLCIDKIG